MRTRFRTGIILLALTASVTASAQYTGPGAISTARTVAEVLQDARDERPVELTGHLVRQSGRETYVFRDATGEITVEIDAEDFPVGRPVGADTRVQIRGEIEARPLRKPRIDVETLREMPAASTP